MEADEQFLRLAIDLARQGREHGDKPFGAVLVENGVVIGQTHNRIYELIDPTAHAELMLISDFCRTQQRFSLRGCTLYCSTEPCPMCAGAIHWAGLSRVVYSVSQAMLQQLTGGSPKMDCATLINPGRQHTEIVGPLMAELGLTVFEGYIFPKWREHRLSGRSKGDTAMNKDELLDAIKQQYARLEGLVKDMGEDERAAPGVVGQWSVKDILAHLTAWDRLLPGWLEAARIGATPIMPTEGYTWRDMDRLNEAIYHANKDSTWDKVITEFREAQQRVLHEVESLSEAELSDPKHYKWMDGKPLATLVAADTCEHYKEFADHIQEWTQVQGGS